MNRVLIILLLLAGLAPCSAAFAQTDCLQAVFAIEKELLHRQQSGECLLLEYTMRTTDWEDETHETSVKLYQKGRLSHLFSAEADIFQDKNEVFIALHGQKILIRTNSSGEVKAGWKDDFLELRREFLEHCTVERCDQEGATGKTRRLVIGIPEDADLDLSIHRIEYRYNPEAQKITRTIMDYEEGYKWKQIDIQFAALYEPVRYAFGASAKANVLDSLGKPKGKYARYTLVDNR
ncbi:MAG: hypothetical protein ABIQ93_13815 [Saprospiraceae bacterium]